MVLFDCEKLPVEHRLIRHKITWGILNKHKGFRKQKKNFMKKNMLSMQTFTFIVVNRMFCVIMSLYFIRVYENLNSTQ